MINNVGTVLHNAKHALKTKIFAILVGTFIEKFPLVIVNKDITKHLMIYLWNAMNQQMVIKIFFNSFFAQ